MRILHLAPRLSARGGADHCLLGLVSAQDDRHDVRVAVGFDDGTARVRPSVSLVPGLEARAAHAVDLDPLLAAFRPDVIHVHHVVNPTALAWAAARDAVLTVQDHRFFCPGRGKWKADGSPCGERMAPDLCAACFEDARYFEDVMALTEARHAALPQLRITVLSDYMRDELVATGVPSARIHVIPPFVHDLDRAAGPDGGKCVLFVGRLVAAKGVLDAAEAWRASGTDLPLVFAGTGSMRAVLEAQGHTVLGWIDRDRLARTYARARALLLPSRWQEPYGIVGLEAMAFGVPVAAWSSGGVAAWHREPDLLAPWGDVPALARALSRALGRRPPRADPVDREAVLAAYEAVYAG